MKNNDIKSNNSQFRNASATPPKAKRSLCTKSEHRKRIDHVVTLLSMGTRSGDVKRALKATYQISGRQAERYMSRARKKILDETGKPRQEHIADSYSIYKQIVEKTGSEQIKLKARARIDKLLGLDAPKRHEVSGPDAGPISAEVTMVRKAMKGLSKDELRAISRLRSNMSGLATGGGHSDN